MNLPFYWITRSLISCGIYTVVSLGLTTATLAQEPAASQVPESVQSLLQIFSLAKRHDAQYQADLAANQSLRQQRGIRSAALKPQISAFYTHQQRDNDIDNTFTNVDNNGQLQFVNVQTSQQDTVNQWGLNLSQTLFDASALATASQGQLEAKVSLVQDQLALQQLVLRTTHAYFDVLRADSALAAATAQLQAQEWLLTQTKARFDVGDVSYTDVHQVQAAVDAARSQQLAASLATNNSRHQLQIITSQRHEQLLPVSTSFRPTALKKTDQQWLQQAKSQALANRLAQLQARIAKLQSRAVARTRLPKVTATASYLDNSVETQLGDFTPFNNANSGTQIALQLEMPLYLGGGIGAQKRQAAANVEQAQHRAAFQQRQIEQQTQSAIHNLQVASQQYYAERQAFTSAKRAARAVQLGYEEGLNTVVDTVQAKQQVFGTQHAFEVAKLRYLSAYLQLQASAGDLDNTDLDYVNRQLASPSEPVSEPSKG